LLLKLQKERLSWAIVFLICLPWFDFKLDLSILSSFFTIMKVNMPWGICLSFLLSIWNLMARIMKSAWFSWLSNFVSHSSWIHGYIHFLL
jgi:hypothetical protein